MPVQRGLIPPALVTSAVVLELCAIAWGALGVLSFAKPDEMPVAGHRYVCLLLATITLGALMVHMSARIMRTIRYAHRLDEPGDGDSYADGYAAGLAARPDGTGAVTRLSRAPR